MILQHCDALSNMVQVVRCARADRQIAVRRNYPSKAQVLSYFVNKTDFFYPLKMKHKLVDRLSRSRHQSAESTITKIDDDFTYDDYKELMKSINANNIQKKLSKIQNFNFTDPKTKNSIIHAVLDGTIKSPDVQVNVLLELHSKGAQIDQPNINGDLALHLAVKNDISEAIDWFYLTNPSLLQTVHSKNHLNLTHYALAYGSFETLKSLHEKQPELISQTITEGALKGYAPITYFLTTLFCKVDVHQDQYLPPEELIDILINEQFKKIKMEPAKKIIEENENLKSIMDFLLDHSPVDTYLIPTKFGTVLHVLVRINYFEGIEKVIEKTKTQDDRLLENIFSSKEPSKNKSPLFWALERSVDEYKSARLVISRYDQEMESKPKVLKSI